MNLITEDIFNMDTSIAIDESSGIKQHYIEGIFLQSEQRNRNGRVYPKPVLKREVSRYIKEYINTKRSIGELSHPNHPEPNPERASHLTVNLREDGDNWIGKAKILSTPMGNIVKGLLDDGVKLGVSSRGLGTIKESNGVKVVQSDYYLSTIDIVASPSAHDAFVNGLMEGVEWIWDNDELVQRNLTEMKDNVNKLKTPSEKDLCALFENFLEILKNKQ